MTRWKFLTLLYKISHSDHIYCIQKPIISRYINTSQQSGNELSCYPCLIVKIECNVSCISSNQLGDSNRCARGWFQCPTLLHSPRHLFENWVTASLTIRSLGQMAARAHPHYIHPGSMRLAGLAVRSFINLIIRLLTQGERSLRLILELTYQL